MDQGARFPKVAAKAGHYESFYIKACRPGGGQGIWIRHTVHKRPGAEPNASIWFVLFDREAEGPRATKVTVPAAELSAPVGSWIRVDQAEIGPGKRERIDRDRGAEAPSWDLTFSGDAEPCKYLPADWLYEAPVPRTKFVAPFPDARFERPAGDRRRGDRARRLAGDDRPQLGQRARRALGLAGGDGFRGFAGHLLRRRRRPGQGRPPHDSLAALGDAGPRRRGPPPRRLRQDPLGLDRGVARPPASSRCPGKDIVVRGRVSAPKKDFVGWVYADPKGPEHHTVNCSVSDLELTVERPARPARQLTLAAGAAYEFGMRETDHGIPIQPYPDG